MPTILKASDFAISRAGANTVYELFANLVPSIFIPLPKSVSRGDQIDNAKYFKAQGLCELIFQENLTIDSLFNKLNNLEKNAETIKQNIKNAHFDDGSQKIIDIILKEKD
jgi:UDP-N-acetylglucosamine--N-acetylmuramyl-(pentapeptide) pyrophosphoryl-undecaprenol N-acetylglucosamine transferase